MTGKKNIAIFASGTGTNAEALIRYFKESGKGKVNVIICNKPGAGVFGVAEREGVPTRLVPNEVLELPGKLREIMKEHDADLIVLAGFLRKIPVDLIDEFKNRIINIHPALLPKFGGKGMYGRKVHEEVIRLGEKESGITIHHVTAGYDEGAVIFQMKIKVEENDTAETLEKKIHELEHKYYPEIIERLLE